MADVALVGFPNAGKSTFISRVSAAKPKVADYPFTTLEPHLGVVRMDDEFEMVIADIPGLISGASEGRGLGHRFLRHVERARSLLVLIDLASVDELDPEEQQRVLETELARYDAELAQRPKLVVGTKADVAFFDWDGRRISSVTGDGVRELLGELRTLVEGARAAQKSPQRYVVQRPVPEGIAVRRLNDRIFEVTGRDATRAVRLSDLTNVEALDHAHARLEKLGINTALAKAGARQGDTVVIGDLEFTFEDES